MKSHNGVDDSALPTSRPTLRGTQRLGGRNTTTVTGYDQESPESFVEEEEMEIGVGRLVLIDCIR